MGASPVGGHRAVEVPGHPDVSSKRFQSIAGAVECKSHIHDRSLFVPPPLPPKPPASVAPRPHALWVRGALGPMKVPPPLPPETPSPMEAYPGPDGANERPHLFVFA